MKKAGFYILAIVGLSFILCAFALIKQGGIQGKVTPAEGVKEIIAVAGTDTLRSKISNGVFVFDQVKKGTYTIWIKAHSPYKDATIQNVAVADIATTDVGEIRLQQ